MKLLIINPGGTSTKIAVFEDEEQILKRNITHTQEELSAFKHVFDQFGYRKKLILEALEEEGIDIRQLSGVAGRGGLMNPIPGGTGSNFKNAGCVLHEHEPGFGQAYIFAGTDKEPDAQLVLQGCNLMAHSRLCNF